MIKEIGCYNFIGFYESIFHHSDEFIDYEGEYEDDLELVCIDKGIDLDIENAEVHMEYVDFNEYKKDVSKAFMELYVDSVIDVLPSEIVNNKDFKFECVEDTTVVVSPKYYNYSTDRCYMEVETNYKTLVLIKWYTLGLKGSEEYIRKYFTSRDGFISFIKNDINYWRQLSIKDYQQNMLIALLDMLLLLSDEDIFDKINMEVVETVFKYEYVNPFVYYNGKDYELEDFYKKVLKE